MISSASEARRRVFMTRNVLRSQDLGPQADGPGCTNAWHRPGNSRSAADSAVSQRLSRTATVPAAKRMPVGLTCPAAFSPDGKRWRRSDNALRDVSRQPDTRPARKCRQCLPPDASETPHIPGRRSPPRKAARQCQARGVTQRSRLRRHCRVTVGRRRKEHAELDL